MTDRHQGAGLFRPGPFRFGPSTALFWFLAAALLVANAVVMWHSLTVLRFWEDEAFNLTVPRNLLAGLGYTSDGTLSGSTLTPFDPRISTGPVVLLPVAAVLATGIDPVIGARLVPLAYWVLLLAGLGILGHRLVGRFGALIAVALPLAFNTAGSVSPIQGPADLLGEIAAAAWIVWALVVLPRRAWLAGFLFGLAVQAKLIALLALPAFAVALFLLTPQGRFRGRLRATLRRGILPLLLAAAPTLLMELIALITLGEGYLRHVRALGGFLLSGGQRITPTTIPQKLITLADAWFVPWWLVTGAALLAVVVIVLAARTARSVAARADRGAAPSATTAPGVDLTAQPPWWDRDPQLLALACASVVGLVTFVGWWAQASQLPLWVRHPAVGVFAFAPIFAAVAVRAVAVLWRHGGTGNARGAVRALTALSAAAVTLIAVGGGLSAAARALQPATQQTLAEQTLAEQRADVAPLAAWVRRDHVEWLAAKPWGWPVSAVVLTGAHVGLYDAPAMRHTPTLGGDACTGGSALAAAPGMSVCPVP